ncbi:MAG: molecular chaperone DnaJ [Gammaproteobacteria bacterium]|nr:molecular chaperone DnaJ [Gammaproteobacteria bacterium]
MILTILAAVLAGAAFVLLVRVYWAKAQPSRSSVVLTTAAIVLVAGLAVLAATGRLHWLAALGAAVFPFLRRGFSLLRFLPLLSRVAPLAGQAFAGRQAHAASAGAGPQSSEVETAELRMTLHHDSGQMDGEILAGPFEGRRLSTLGLDELRSLRAALTDGDSVRLLDSYLERQHPGWDDTGESTPGEPADGQMNEARALEVLGLEAGATEEDVIEAHRRLIQRLHPDRGGSTFLAATLNEAKRVLLRD